MRWFNNFRIGIKILIGFLTACFLGAVAGYNIYLARTEGMAVSYLVIVAAIALALAIIFYVKHSIVNRINKLVKLAESFSKGNINVNFDSEYKDETGKLSKIFAEVYNTVKGLNYEIGKTVKSIEEGTLNTKTNTANFSGIWKEAAEGFNRAIGAVARPLDEAKQVLEKMGVSDYTVSMSDSYPGVYGELSDAINTVQKRLLYVQKIVTMVSEGDGSEIENLRKIGKFSDNDQLTPAFIRMIETIQNLNNEVDELAKEAINGNLEVRGNADKFKGGYRKTIEGFNKTLEAIIDPVKEAINVLKELSNGNLQVSVEGNYKGDHAVLKNALNDSIKAIDGYIDEISEVLLEISNANLDVGVCGDFKGDFVKIKDSINMIIDALNDDVSKINSATEQTATGANQVSTSSQVLSQGASEQASSIEEITSTVTQVAAQIKQNAENVNKVNELGVSSKDAAIQGETRMQEMLKAMDEINQSSLNISKIIKVIDEIAFQTNILALNAAVEAARAGQHGKGFAVVAEEVRNLAARSANAAKETTELIEGSVKNIESGTKIANGTAEALHKIVGAVEESAELIGDVAVASNEQATAISQINQAIEEVSQVVQTNSATAEEGAAASEELLAQAEILKDLVSKFKLRKEDTNQEMIDGLSPDIIKAIQDISGKKTQNHINKNSVTKEELSTAKPKVKISLNDEEFGKY